MSREETKDLLQFLHPFGEDITSLVLWLRDFVWKLYPSSNELLYDNYNALAFGWSPTDRVSHTFCSIAVGRTSKNIHFGFYWGSKLSDEDQILLGEGNQYRYVLVTNKKDFPTEKVKKLMAQAYAYSLSLVKDKKQLSSGRTIVKSISEKKRGQEAKKPLKKKK